MQRANITAVKFAATLAACTFSLLACARSPDAAAAEAALAKWRVGTNYAVLERPQPPQAAKGKVVVNEVFWYGCGHCYALDPTLEEWDAKNAAYIEFARIPVVWGPPHKQHARLFYVLEQLERPDLHVKVFESIHRSQQLLASPVEADARALQLEFVKQHGVTESQFNAAYDSPAVTAQVEAAERATGRFAVASVPLIVVNGKYTTGVTQAGGTNELISLMDDLAASEQSR
jgi:thiol:disulfide interchange protein DsbA